MGKDIADEDMVKVALNNKIDSSLAKRIINECRSLLETNTK